MDDVETYNVSTRENYEQHNKNLPKMERISGIKR